MRTVVIGGTNWVESHPQRVRGDLVRMVFSLAAQNRYEVVVAGQHWQGNSRPAPVPKVQPRTVWDSDTLSWIPNPLYRQSSCTKAA